MIGGAQLDRLIEWRMRREERYVGRPLPWWRTVVAFLVVIALLAARIFFDGWLDAVTYLILSCMAGAWVASGLNRAAAYRRGYHNGRRAVIESMQDAMRRQLPFETWWHGELERTVLLFNQENVRSEPMSNPWQPDGSHEDLP